MFLKLFNCGAKFGHMMFLRLISELQVRKMGKSKNINVNKRDVLKWTQPMDDILIDALLHQQSLGNRVDKVFTTMAYENMVNELHQKIGIPIEKGHLKNRIKTLKHNFYECYDLFKGRSGFAWSPDTKMWTAKPELWKSKPDSKKWMTTRIANYDKLLMLFAKDREKKDGAKGGQWASSIGGGLFDCIPLQDVLGLTMEENDMNDTSQTDSQAPSQSATSLKGKKRKAPRIELLERELKSIREAIKDVADAIREGNLIAERGRPRVYTEQEVFAELVNIGIDTQLRYKAYAFLIANAGRVRALFGCPAEERKEFLLQMMYSSEDSAY
ncbi:uncharacterized protein LOC111312916 isoform X2 [Durio zibethinus]|uniref:Uncharacterized protein LOC111312916 isoform X2 n=1 Tax=Durio zibethinus TaxID=66656 RepID=A0A6P6AX05_DURZI|nr:uncharacterized protein LOC111312916 isoform X2 [Durio zibethinus]